MHRESSDLPPQLKRLEGGSGISGDQQLQFPPRPSSLPRPLSFAGSMTASVVGGRRGSGNFPSSSIRASPSSSASSPVSFRAQRNAQPVRSSSSKPSAKSPHHFSSTITVKHKDGNRYKHGVSFIDRLRAPVKIEDEDEEDAGAGGNEHPFGSFSFGGGGGKRRTGSLRQKKFGDDGGIHDSGGDNRRQSSQSNAEEDHGDISDADNLDTNSDDDDEEDDELLKGGTIGSLRRLSLMSAGGDSALGGGEDDSPRKIPLKRKSSMAQFFKNMKKEINVIKRWKGVRKEGPAQAEGGGGHYKKEPVGLSKYVEETNQKRVEVDAAFNRLQKTEQRYVESKQQLHMHKRSRERHHNLAIAGVMQPACALMRSLWAQFRVSVDEQRRFSNAHFEPATVENYLIISREVQKYGKKTLLSDDAMRLISLRETYLKQIFHVARNQTIMCVENRTMQESLVIELYNAVLMLRYCTCAIIDILYLMRDTEAKTTVLKWEGQNYVEKMQEDLTELEDTNLKYLIGKKYSFSSNPMLLPRELQLEQLKKDKVRQRELLNIVAKSKGERQTRSESMMSMSGAGTTHSTTMTMDEVFPEDILDMSTTSSMSPSAKRASKSAMDKLGITSSKLMTNPKGNENNSSRPPGGVPQLNDTTTSHNGSFGSQRSAGASTVATTTTMSPSKMRKTPTPTSEERALPSISKLRPAGGVRRANTPTVFVVHEGEVAPSAKKKSTRAQYFEMKQKTASRQQHRKDNSFSSTSASMQSDEGCEAKEHSHTKEGDATTYCKYNYPSHIYLPKPRPAWETTGELLVNSLDPRISILQQPYEDLSEYECMQFGRVNVPPSFIIPRVDDVVDEEQKCYRMSVPVPNYTFSELHKHEVLIFGESALSKKRGAQLKLKRGLLKLRIVYRGFTSRLNTLRSQSTNTRMNLKRGVEYFSGWVREFAPEWSEEIEKELDLYTTAELTAAMVGDDASSMVIGTSSFLEHDDTDSSDEEN